MQDLTEAQWLEKAKSLQTRPPMPWFTVQKMSASDLRAIYEGEAKLSAKDDVVVYCRIGERSSHTWFVLTHLLGYPKVRNYDGSWTEWGNLVGVPIER